MKKRTIACSGFLYISFLLAMSAAALPKSFEGIITYKITYPDSKFTESQLAMFPKILTVTVKGDHAKSEYQTAMGTQVEITNFKEKTKVGMISMMGQKYAIMESAEEIAESLKTEPPATVQLSEETKNIAGYACKKAIVTVDDDGSKTTYEVWYSTDFGAPETNFDSPLYKDIKGVLLEFSINAGQFIMKFTAASVDKKSVSNKEFEVPPDYIITTKEELKAKFGGMQQ